jgi:hypothetical protein
MWTGVMLSLVLSQAPLPPGTGAEIIAINEYRSRSFTKDPFAGLDTLKVIGQLHGPPVKAAYKFGNLKVASAVDDLKNVLVLRPKDGVSAFHTSDQPELRLIQEYERPRGTDRLQFSLELKTTPRRAKTVSVNGTIDLMTGTPMSVEFARVKSLEGSDLSNADLDALKLKVRVVKPGKDFLGKPAEMLVLRLEGDDRPVIEYNLLDAAGKKLNTFHPFVYPNADKSRGLTFDLGKNVPADATLQIKFLKGVKVTTVPFEFKQTELP